MTKPQHPRYTARVKLRRNMQRPKWVDVGSAFLLEDGRLNLVMDTLPVREDSWDGTIVLFPPAPDDVEVQDA